MGLRHLSTRHMSAYALDPSHWRQDNSVRRSRTLRTRAQTSRTLPLGLLAAPDRDRIEIGIVPDYRLHEIELNGDHHVSGASSIILEPICPGIQPTRTGHDPAFRAHPLPTRGRRAPMSGQDPFSDGMDEKDDCAIHRGVQRRKRTSAALTLAKSTLARYQLRQHGVNDEQTKDAKRHA